MGIMQRAIELFGFATRAEGGGSGVVPPARTAAPVYVSPDQAVTISDVFRAIQVIGTSAGQLNVEHLRGRAVVDQPAAIIRRPQLDLETPHFIEETVLDLATHGNAYWRKIMGAFGVVELRKLTPAEVHVALTLDDQVVYSWRGKDIPAAEMLHLKFLRRTGHPLGLGPIQAAQIELQGTIEARDYGSTWLSSTTIPTGVLTTEQPLTDDQAKTYKAIWRGDGEALTGHDIRVIGSGLKYNPISLKPADVQFIETRQFNKTQLATLFGIPSSLLLAAIEGTSQTYANVEQEWIGFTRFTLLAYLRPIEVAFSSLLPFGNTAKFNVDELLRADTVTRYQGHEIGIRAGFLLVDEARAIEGLPALPAGTTTPAPAPATDQEVTA